MEVEISYHPKVAAAATQAPVQFRVLIGIGVEQLAVGRDDIEPKNIVEREAEASPHPAKAGAQSQATNTGVRNRTGCCDEAVEAAVITAQQRELMTSAVLERKNILIAGGTGSGKTTLTNALLEVIAESGQRIITIEDTKELRCNASNAVSLYTRLGVCSMHDLVVDTLRYRPDRIVIGEMRDGGACALEATLMDSKT